MKSSIETKSQSVLQENKHEEIADIPKTIAEGVIIDVEENFEDESVIELDLEDSEELAVNSEPIKTITIVDELEDKSADRDALSKINIEKLAIQIDSLTSVQKRDESYKYADQILLDNDIVSPQKEVKKEGKEEETREEKEILKLKEELKQEEIDKPIEEKKDAKEAIEEKIEVEFERDEKKDIIETSRNILTIEIPDKLLDELPAGFNVDEFGKIDLNEAEIIAEEDILSLTKGELSEELEELDIFPDQNKKTPGFKKRLTRLIARTKNVPEKKEESEQNEINDIKKIEETEGKEKEIQAMVSPEHEKIIKEKEPGYPEINVINEESPKTRATEDIKEDSKAEIIEPEEIIPGKEKKIDADTKEKDEKELIIKVSFNPETNMDTQHSDDIFDAEIKDENVFIIDNETVNKERADKSIPQTDELEDLTSNIADVVEGKAKQLTESEITDKKAITGLIRDNYPTFIHLLKEKELEDKHTHFDEDIAFVGNSLLSKEQARRLTKVKIPATDLIKKRTVAPNEQILGLLPDELNFIESQVFNIKAKEIDRDKTASKISLSQPSDTIAATKYKYILPVPDSLLENEKKSIEDDISASGALIYEEDVDKIKRKLEDSMKKKIEETIQDITHLIIIYEDNKTRKKASESLSGEKEEIKRLLKYLDELLNKLPEDIIKDFADSEYYELYKKVLKDTDE